MNLRDLTNDQLAIKQLVENGDLTADDVKDHLDSLTEDRNAKIENILFVINELDSRESTLDAEIARLNESKKSTSNNIEKLKNYLLLNMEDGEKHEFDLFKVSRVKGREVVNILSESDIPKDYMTHKPETWSPDKRKILSDLKKGNNINGAEITKGKPSLRIK